MDLSGLIQQSGSYSPVAGNNQEVEYELEVSTKGASLEELIRQLMSLASYTNKLYTQSHLIHLNIEGPLFFPLHDFFKEQYQSNIDNFDIISELIRSMNYLMPMCEKGLSSVCPNFQHVTSYDTRSMATTYIQNLEKLGMAAKEVGATARVVGAPDAENKMADLVNSCFKASWMLKATLRG